MSEAGWRSKSLPCALHSRSFFVLSHWPTILAEERKLRGVYGERYNEYARTVPRLLPRISQLKWPTSVTFSPTVFNRGVSIAR